MNDGAKFLNREQSYLVGTGQSDIGAVHDETGPYEEGKIHGKGS